MLSSFFAHLYYGELEKRQNTSQTHPFLLNMFNGINKNTCLKYKDLQQCFPAKVDLRQSREGTRGRKLSTSDRNVLLDWQV